MSQQSFLLTVAPGDTAAGREWTIIVRNSITSSLRVDLEQSGIVGTPVMTVRRCRVTRSVLGDEQWTVEQFGSTAPAADGVDGLQRLFGLLSCSPRTTTPSGDNY